MALTFKNAEEARDAILASQKKEIASLYEKWADARAACAADPHETAQRILAAARGAMK